METLIIVLLVISWLMSLALVFMLGFGSHAKMINGTICAYSNVLKSALNKVMEGFNNEKSD